MGADSQGAVDQMIGVCSIIQYPLPLISPGNLRPSKGIGDSAGAHAAYEISLDPAGAPGIP